MVMLFGSVPQAMNSLGNNSTISCGSNFFLIVLIGNVDVQLSIFNMLIKETNM
jgi:hypothetical protein